MRALGFRIKLPPEVHFCPDQRNVSAKVAAYPPNVDPRYFTSAVLLRRVHFPRGNDEFDRETVNKVEKYARRRWKTVELLDSRFISLKPSLRAGEVSPHFPRNRVHVTCGKLPGTIGAIIDLSNFSRVTGSRNQS